MADGRGFIMFCWIRWCDLTWVSQVLVTGFSLYSCLPVKACWRSTSDVCLDYRRGYVLHFAVYPKGMPLTYFTSFKPYVFQTIKRFDPLAKNCLTHFPRICPFLTDLHQIWHTGGSSG